MPAQTRSLLLILCFLSSQLSHASATATPPTEEVARCNSSEMVEVNSVMTVKKSINFWSCDQNLIHVRAGPLTTLIDTLHESPSFVFIPSSGFEYFEVLFRRGTRATVFRTLKISDVMPGQYIVRIVFKFVPTASYTPSLAVEVGVTSLSSWRNAGHSNLSQLLDDKTWYANPSLKKYSCESPPEPKRLQLSQVIIRVQGASQWQYIPLKSLCPSEASSNSSDPNSPSSDASRSFSDPTTDETPEYVSTTPSGTRNLPPRSSSTSTTSSHHPPTGPPLSGYTEQGTRGPRFITAHAAYSTTEEGFPSEGFFEEGVKNGTRSGVMRLSTPLISGIIGGLAILLLIIGCCVLFKHLNFRGSYGIHSSTYEAESSLHLRDSHYNSNNTPATSPDSSPVTTASSPATVAGSPVTTASSPATVAGSPVTTASSPATAQPYPGPPSITINAHPPDEAPWRSGGKSGEVNPSMDMSQEVTK